MRKIAAFSLLATAIMVILEFFVPATTIATHLIYSAFWLLLSLIASFLILTFSNGIFATFLAFLALVFHFSRLATCIRARGDSGEQLERAMRDSRDSFLYGTATLVLAILVLFLNGHESSA